MNNLGIVILNYRNYNLSMKCLDNLLSLKVGAYFVIVDNNSQNDSYEHLLSKYKNIDNVDVINTSFNGGYSYGNNVGIHFLLNKYQNTEYICIINPDVEIEYKEIFNNLVKKLETHDDIAAITGIMQIRGKTSINNSFWKIPNSIEIATGNSILANLKENKLTENNENIVKVDVIPGSFFIIKVSVLERIGYLDENIFLYNEENTLAIKIKNIGLTNAISTNDYYNHNHQKKDKKLVDIYRQRKISDASRRYLCKKFYSIPSLILLDVVIVTNYILIPFKYLKKKIRQL